MKKTLPVQVYRCGFTDCTNGGISSRCHTLYLEHPGGFHEVEDDDPRLIRIVERTFGWRDTPYLHVEQVSPSVTTLHKVGPMFGGNFVYTSDSRFPSDYPIPIHDRFETQEQYDQLSR